LKINKYDEVEFAVVIFCSLLYPYYFFAGKIFYKKCKINFYSSTPLEDIEAKNKSAVCVLDTKAGNLQFSTLIKGFEFENEEMQEHFNDHYLESDKFPKSELRGKYLTTLQLIIRNQGLILCK
jgi:hypothetical protein